jgi:predicted acetyltransferase
MGAMGILIRTATADDTDAMRQVDGRNFGFDMTQADLELRTGVMDLDRFFLAFDGRELIGITGSFSFDVTLPGGATLPMGGVTWVSVAVTHRRRGVMSQLMARAHADIDERGEPLAMLGASEGGIYERLGYGISSRDTTYSIATQRAVIDDDRQPAPPPGAVRFVSDDDVIATVTPLWDRYRITRPHEVSRSEAWHRMMLANRQQAEGEETRGFYLAHRDGYASYRVVGTWTDRAPAHTLWVNEFVALTPAAHGALWHTLLSTDLVTTVKTRCIPPDDPLGYLLTDQRQFVMATNHDGGWTNIRDVARAFSTRRYAVADRVVIEVDGVRYAIDGGPDHAGVSRVRSKPDVTLTHAAAGSLLFGGVGVSALTAGRRATARDAATARRLDAFFRWSPDPYSQTQF